jgi:hypothetical protein
MRVHLRGENLKIFVVGEINFKTCNIYHHPMRITVVSLAQDEVVKEQLENIDSTKISLGKPS